MIDRSAYMTKEAESGSPIAVTAKEGDILYRLRDLSPGYGNIIQDAVAEIERLRIALAAVPAPDAGLVEREAIATAYIAGATAVDAEWRRAHDDDEGPPSGDPEFNEAAQDYAALLSRSGAGEPVAWRYRMNETWPWTVCREKPGISHTGYEIESLYATPAPSGRDPATIEAELHDLRVALAGVNKDWNEAVRRAETIRVETIEACAKVAKHLNGWGSPPRPDIAAHIAVCIRSLASPSSF